MNSKIDLKFIVIDLILTQIDFNADIINDVSFKCNYFFVQFTSEHAHVKLQLAILLELIMGLP